MSFNSLNQYSGSHKAWDHVGNVIPPVEHSEGIRPGCYQPAAWLPVKFYDKHYENWMTVMPGQPVALDPDGYLMPAEYGLTSTTSVVYGANDYAAGVIDISTGLPLTTSSKTVRLDYLTGTRGASWTTALAGTNGSTYASGFMGRFGESFVSSTVKYPIGVCPLPYLQWCGGDGFNPAEYYVHNYNMQHKVPILCDAVLSLPYVPGQVASETVDKTVTGTALVIGTAAVHTRHNAQANATGRYNATTGSVPVTSSDMVIALALANYPLAKQTSRTLIALASTSTADDVSSVLVTEVGTVAAVNSAGKYFVDYPAGVIFIYSSDATTIPAAITGAAGTVSITYYHTGTTASVLSSFCCVLGSVSPGDFLKCGTSSNWVPATPGSDHEHVMGQVIGFDKYPKDALDRVRTAYSPAINTSAAGSMANAVAGSSSVHLGQMDQMPGSATGGYPDKLHYAGGADTLVLINLISR